MNRNNKIKASIIFAIAGWCAGMFGIAAFWFGMTEASRYAPYACMFSSVAMLTLLISSIISITRGGMEIIKGRANAEGDSIQTPAAIALGCLGFLISICIFSILGYYLNLYLIMRS